MLHITPIYAGLLALIFVALSLRVIGGRLAAGVGLGDGGDADLFRRIRVQGNFAEYAPMGLLMLAIAELQGAGPAWLNGFGTMLVAGRLAHAIGLGASPQIAPLRGGGMMLTFIAIAGLGLLCLARALG